MSRRTVIVILLLASSAYFFYNSPYSGPAVVPLASEPAKRVATPTRDPTTSPPWHIAAGMFTVSMPLFPMNKETGLFDFPAGIKRVIIDVGTHDESEYFSSLGGQPELMLLGMEPTPKIYHKLALGSLHERFWAFPVAVGPKEGYQTFYDAEFERCSSLLQPTEEEAAEFGGLSTCLQNSGKTTVPVVSLESILRLIPIPDIEFIKIDAQGFDVDVFLSAGTEAKRVQRVQLELQELEEGDKRLLYKGQKTKASAIKLMKEIGFEYEHCSTNNAELKEQNCLFRRMIVP